jgi:hypothetical protein
MPLLICYVLRFSTPCAEWDDLAILLAGAFPGVTCHSFKWTRVGRIPTSYPTEPSRRLMGPAANARTDPKVYVDCHEDYRISATIYTNRLSKSRDILTLFFYKKWTTGLVFPSNCHAGLDLLTPFSLSSPRRRGSPSRIFIYIFH